MWNKSKVFKALTTRSFVKNNQFMVYHLQVTLL